MSLETDTVSVSCMDVIIYNGHAQCIQKLCVTSSVLGKINVTPKYSKHLDIFLMYINIVLYFAKVCFDLKSPCHLVLGASRTKI